MRSSRQLTLSATILVALAVSPVEAIEAGKLLPGDTKAIVALNLRQLLADHRNTEFVQRYVEQWRLAMKGDERQLKDYFRRQELNKYEGISEQAFLGRARNIKTICDALGIDPLEDIDRITVGCPGGGQGPANDAGSFILIVEGRFNQEKVKAGIQQIAKSYFGSFEVSAAGDVTRIPDGPDEKYVSLVDARTLVITDDKKAMDDLLARAAGKRKDLLAKGMRTLLDSVRKEHVGVVVAEFDVQLNKLTRFLKDDVAKALDAKGPVAKFIVTQGADWIGKYANDLSSAGLGFSLREDELRLQLGFDARKTEIAKDLQKQIQTGNFWGALALKAIGNDVARQLATIVLQQRVTLKETTLTTRIEVPYDFIKLAVKGPWLALLSKDFAPAGPPGPMPAASQTALDAVTTRITSIPLWTLPARDKTKPLPAGTFEVLETRDIVYQSGSADPYRHRLDMYLPKGKKDFPVLVLVHGGAWVVGDNRCAGLYPSVAQFLASQGIGVVMPNYRLSPGVKHPEHAKDVARAVAWTHANIGKHGGDLQRFYLAGHSAGGHLVALLAADESYLRAVGMKPADVKGVIAVSGVYNIPADVMRFSLGGSGPRALRFEQQLPFRGDSPPSFKYQLPGLPAQLNMFAPVFGATARECAAASPLTHVHRGMPPFLILFAEHDLPTLSEMADEFHQALVQKGCASRLLKMAKRNHNSILFSAIHPGDPAAQAILAFIGK